MRLIIVAKLSWTSHHLSLVGIFILSKKSFISERFVMRILSSCVSLEEVNCRYVGSTTIGPLFPSTRR